MAPSFVARRKIGEKGVPRRRKLHILRFAFRGKSSVIPLLLLSPPNPLRWALAGAPFCTVSTDSCLLHVVQRIRNTYRISSLICGRKSGGSVSLPVFLSSAARRGKGISDSAAADLIASNAPLREGRHTARQNPPKHYPQGIQGDRNPLGTPFSSIFRRAAKDGVPEGRRSSSAARKS